VSPARRLYIHAASFSLSLPGSSSLPDAITIHSNQALRDELVLSADMCSSCRFSCTAIRENPEPRLHRAHTVPWWMHSVASWSPLTFPSAANQYITGSAFARYIPSLHAHNRTAKWRCAERKISDHN